MTCVNSTITLSATLSDFSSASGLQWDLGNGDTKSGASVTSIYAQPGSYLVKVYPSVYDACTDTAQHLIVVSGMPNVNAGRDSFVCAGSSLLLTASGADTYRWQQVNASLSCTECTNPIATPSATVNYIVTGKNGAGCSGSDTVFIDVQEKEWIAVAMDQLSVCSRNRVQLQATGTDHYQWQPAESLSNAAISNPTALPVENTVYSVTGSDSRQCFTDSKDIAVTVRPLPGFNIADSVITISRGMQTTLSGIGTPDIVNWSWTPATGLNCSTCPQPVLTATIAGTYVATASTAEGCSAKDSVKILLMCDQSGIFVPTAFTPNHDGKNDYFYPKSYAPNKILAFSIFNRNGEVVYHKRDVFTNVAKDGWDGMYKGFYLPTGIYIYHLEIVCDKNIIPYTGTVTLIR